MINQKWKSVMAVLLAVSMIPTTMPVSAQTVLPESKAAVQEAETDTEENNYEEGEAIILYENTSSTAKTFKSGEDLGQGVEVVEVYEFETPDSQVSAKSSGEDSQTGSLVALVRSEDYSTEELITYLNKRSDIKYAEPNYKVKAFDTGDPYKKYQWALENTGQNGGTEGYDINADTESLNTSVNNEEKVVAIVDTGMDYTHEDLADMVWENPFSSRKLKGKHGYDVYNNDSDPMDDNGHGTHCAGIVAASTDNGVGVAGTAQSSNIKIMSLKFLDEDGYGDLAGAISAYNYIYKAQQLGVNVVAVNNSWGGEAEDYETEIFAQVIEMVGEAGALSVCAAGNEAYDNDEYNCIPANIDSDYVISVAASNENDELASFSNYGDNVDLAAPGTAILSTVSYNTFNPTLYDNKDDICSTYEDFESKTLVQTMEDGKENGVEAGNDEIGYGLENDGSGTVSVSISDEQYFGDKAQGIGSLKWTVENATAGDIYTLYLPYTAEKSSTALYDGLAVRTNGPTEMGDDYDYSILWLSDGQLKDGSYDMNNEIVFSAEYMCESNYWSYASGQILSKVNDTQQRAIALQIYAESDGDYTVYIDNVGVSKSNVSADSFGKYDYYSGTSMATPYVTGAVAAVADAYEDEDALTRKSRIMGSVRKSDALEGYVATGGTLDLSQVDSPCMTIMQATLNDDKQIEIKGYYLLGAQVKINDTDAEVIEQTDSLIIIDGSSYLNKSITLEITKGDDSVTKKYFFGYGDSFDEENGIYDGYLYDGTAVSDGEKIYYIDATGDVSAITPDEDGAYFQWDDYYVEYTPEMFDDVYKTTVNYTITTDSEIICSNKKLYAVMTLDVGFAQERTIMCFDETNGWYKYAEIPDTFQELSGVIIASYNGTLYVAGGVDDDTGVCSTAVMSYDEDTEAWTDEAELPEGRCFSKAIQTGSKLVITLGGNGTDDDISNLIFDGSQWTVSQAGLLATAGSDTYTCSADTVSFPVLKAQTGVIKNGIIYTDIQAEDLGDTFTYDLNKDEFISTGYCLDSASLDGDQLIATTVGSKLYVIYGEGYSYYYDEDDYYYKDSSISGSDDEYYFDEDDYYYYYEDEVLLNVCSVPVECGFINVTDESGDGAYVEGAGYYLPGDTITLVPKISEVGYIMSFTVDGKKISEDSSGDYSYETLADGSFYTLKTSAQAGIYVTEIYIDSETVVLSPAESYEMYTEVYPSYATNQNLNWTTSDSSVATVNSDGVITAAANAKDGDTAVIRVTATDRSTVYAECVVLISGSSLGVNSTVKVGKFTYKVTKFSGSKKTVTCVSLNKKKAKKAVIPATITVNGYKFKVTAIGAGAFKNCKKLKKVTVGKNVTTIKKQAWKGCKKLTKLTLKSSKIKKFGKNILKGVSKKLVVSVPKKCRKSYKKKLKKTGYSGKIK